MSLPKTALFTLALGAMGEVTAQQQPDIIPPAIILLQQTLHLPMWYEETGKKEYAYAGLDGRQLVVMRFRKNARGEDDFVSGVLIRNPGLEDEEEVRVAANKKTGTDELGALVAAQKLLHGLKNDP